jgi:NADH-quinone oxidoreductase subunit F
MAQHHSVLLRHIAHADQHTMSGYESRGGYAQIRKALGMEPAKVTEEVLNSGLRGRGGAGFPTGKKWTFIPKGNTKPVYLINNADESEPGTFKDRVLLEKDPHQTIEGMMIAAWAVGAHWACVYIRGEYAYPYVRLQEAVKECYRKGYLGKKIFGSDFDLDLVVHRGAGAYICGEETALIESLEGRKGQPRIKPPYFPAAIGLYDCPTIVNNAETLSAIPWIIEHGAESYKAIGTEKSAGTKLFSASGHINKPGVYEVDMGYPLLDFLHNELGGIRGGKKLKAIIPGGSSFPILRADELEGVTLDYESIQKAGSMLGSGGFIVMDETVDMAEAALNIARFYAHESCGQCTPCREGGHWIEKIFKRISRGGGKAGDVELIQSISKQIEGQTICVFGEALAWPAQAFLRKYPDEFKELIARAESGASPRIEGKRSLLNIYFEGGH